MNKTIITVITSSILLIMTYLSAEVKGKRGDDFLRINDNIQNEELRAELEGLREEFMIEKNRIHEYYNEKMENLKKTKRGEIKTIKNNFAERREVLMKKYAVEMRTKPQKRTPESVKKESVKMKAPKDKRKM